MAEQFLHRSGVELVDALEFLGVNAAGHEQAVDAEAVRARQIRPHGIPDRQHAVEPDRMALALGGELDGALIDRPVRLLDSIAGASEFWIARIKPRDVVGARQEAPYALTVSGNTASILVFSVAALNGLTI